jgi:hypothetical protein
VGDEEDAAAVARGKAGGARGGVARSARLAPKRREEIARVTATARWKKFD